MDPCGVPRSVEALFHEVAPGQLDPEAHRLAIVERVLSHGDLEAWRWVFRRYGRSAVADVVRRSHSLDPMTVGFLCLVLEVPQEETLCFSTPSLLTSGAFSRGWGKKSAFDYPYALLEPPAVCESVKVAGKLDLALMKLIAIAQRGRRRDFVDLYALLQTGLDLGACVRRAPDKFQDVRTAIPHLLRALTYFVDAEQDPPVAIKGGPAWEEIRAWFQREVPRVALDIIM